MNKLDESIKKVTLEERLHKTTLKYFVILLISTGIPKLILGIAIILSIVSALAGLIVPLFTGNMIDQFRLESLIATAVLQLVSFFILQALSGGNSYYLLAYVGNQMVNNLRKQLWKA